MDLAKPCPRCSSIEKTKRGRCAPCDRARKRNAYARSDKDVAKVLRRQWYTANKDKVVAQTVAWAGANPEKRAELIERGRLKKYGLTIAQYHQLHEQQSGRCRICDRALSDGVHIDHDHATLVVRGLLCPKCNIGLGHFEDDPQRLRRAAAYLKSKPTTFKVLAPSPFRDDDGRRKVSLDMEAKLVELKRSGRSLSQIAREVGLSRSWVWVVLKRKAG